MFGGTSFTGQSMMSRALWQIQEAFFVRSHAFDIFVGSSIPSFWKWRFYGGKETDDGSFHGFANQ